VASAFGETTVKWMRETHDHIMRSVIANCRTIIRDDDVAAVLEVLADCGWTDVDEGQGEAHTIKRLSVIVGLREALTLDNLALATAAKNCKGFVIAQVERIAASGSLNPRSVPEVHGEDELANRG
jgi:hypothetical protein